MGERELEKIGEGDSNWEKREKGKRVYVVRMRENKKRKVSNKVRNGVRENVRKRNKRKRRMGDWRKMEKEDRVKIGWEKRSLFTSFVFLAQKIMKFLNWRAETSFQSIKNSKFSISAILSLDCYRPPFE